MSKAQDFLEKIESVKPTNEEFDVKQAIKDLVDSNFSGSDDEQGKAAQLLKGLFFSDDPMAKKFVKELDKATSAMDAADFEA